MFGSKFNVSHYFTTRYDFSLR